MIKLTRLRGESFYINPDLIELIEETPDTVITLVDGKKVIVTDTPAEVTHRITLFRATVLTVVARLENAQDSEAHR